MTARFAFFAAVAMTAQACSRNVGSGAGICFPGARQLWNQAFVGKQDEMGSFGVRYKWLALPAQPTQYKGRPLESRVWVHASTPTGRSALRRIARSEIGLDVHKEKASPSQS